MGKTKIVRPTMDDVAAKAGVSQMTVSRVMDNTGYFSQEMRNRVEAAAAEIGYAQNQLARALRSEKTSLVAVALPTLVNTVFTEVLQGITDALTNKGFRPVFGLTEYSEAVEEKLIRDLLSWQPAGILLPGLEHSANTRKAIRASGVPSVEIMDIDGTPISKAFGVSQFNAGVITAKYMLTKGYRRFAYIGSQSGRDIRAAKRFAGFNKTINEAGATLLSQDISTNYSSLAEGRRLTATILARAKKADAIYYSNDDLAAGGIMHCLANGINIPTQIALAGFNHLPFLDALPIMLTTVATPRYEMGLRAGSYLMNVAENTPAHEPDCIDLGLRLIHGQTC